LFSAWLIGCCFLVISTVTWAATDPPCIHVDGKPFFVIGCYDYPGGDDLNPTHLKEMKDAGINALHWTINCVPKSYPNPPRDFTIHDLDTAHKLGLKVVAALNSVAPWTKEDIPNNWGSSPEQFRPGSALHKQLMEIKDHSALLMYETMDEPLGCRMMHKRDTWPSLDTLRKCYHFVKSVDPVHPIWCNEVAWFWCKDRLTMAQFRAWSRICDVYSQDDYPVGGPAYPESPLFVIAEDLDAMMRIVSASPDSDVPTKPLMMVLQGQGRNMMAADRPEIHRRNPNKIETRFVAYSSIVHGAKGIWWWGTRDLVPLRDDRGRLTPNGEFWEIIKLVSREISELREVYCTQRILTGFTLGDKRLDAALFRSAGVNYLIVTNKSEHSLIDVSISADGCDWKASPDKTVTVLFEQRKVNSDGTTWRDTFAPWDVHVYTDRS